LASMSNCALVSSAGSGEITPGKTTLRNWYCRSSSVPAVVPENPIHAIRAMRQNQLIIRRDDCDASWAWDVCRQPVQVAAPT
jgi:hypothetical protein